MNYLNYGDVYGVGVDVWSTAEALARQNNVVVTFRSNLSPEALLYDPSTASQPSSWYSKLFWDVLKPQVTVQGNGFRRDYNPYGVPTRDYSPFLFFAGGVVLGFAAYGFYTLIR